MNVRSVAYVDKEPRLGIRRLGFGGLLRRIQCVGPGGRLQPLPVIRNVNCQELVLSITGNQECQLPGISITNYR